MPLIVFVESSGETHRVDAKVGDSVMRAALTNLVPGILADCGGNCACATCHVYIGEEWGDRILPASREETEMIECAQHVTPQSRLSCQVLISAELEGMTVRLPESQT